MEISFIYCLMIQKRYIFPVFPITSFKSGDFQKGGVITNLHDNILVTHRIVEVKNDSDLFITKGDNNNAPD